jgi:hypothetical protein
MVEDRRRSILTTIKAEITITARRVQTDRAWFGLAEGSE